MGPEKIAPVVAYLLSEDAKDVTGQIFAVRMNEIFLMSQSRPLRSIHRGEGWTPQTIAEHGMPALKSSFYNRTPPLAALTWTRSNPRTPYRPAGRPEATRPGGPPA